MRWLALVIVLVALPAAGRPISPKSPGSSARPVPINSTIACPSTPDWATVQRCLDRRGKVILLHDLADAKLVALPVQPNVLRIELYVLVDAKWTSATMTWTTGLGSELLNFAAFKGDAYRVDVGTAYETSLRVDEALGVQHAIVKRINSTVCPRRSFCRTVTTSCDVLVRGRSYKWFRGQPVWNGKTLKVNGDVRNAGQQCRIATSLLTTEDP